MMANSATKPARKKLAVVIERQMKSLFFEPHTLWQVRIRDQFPKLEEPAVRACNMSTQSANVEPGRRQGTAWVTTVCTFSATAMLTYVC